MQFLGPFGRGVAELGSMGRAIAASLALGVLLAATPAQAQQSVDHPDAVVARPL